MEEIILKEIKQLDGSFSNRLGVPVALLVLKGVAPQKEIKIAIKSLWLKDKITLNFNCLMNGKIQPKPAKELFSKTPSDNQDILDAWYFGNEDSFLGLFVSSV